MSDEEIKNDEHTSTTVPCRLEVTEHKIHRAVELPTLLAHKFKDGKIAGIVWTTNGTRQVPDVKSACFDDSGTYEIRLWQVIDDADTDSTLAHEFRWAHGVGAVELTLTEDTAEATSEGSESKPVSGWFRKVSFLQHQSAEGRDADSSSEATSAQTGESKEDATTKQMTAVEFIQAEDKYGNMVVTDQLFTGEWKYNA
jgi:hypothetical protein